MANFSNAVTNYRNRKLCLREFGSCLKIGQESARPLAMKINQLDHVNMRTSQLSVMIEWYTDVLGLHQGDRPDFSFPGAWMYAGDAAFVHLVSVDGKSGAGSETDLKLEHFAFSATGGRRFVNRLQEMGVEYERLDIPDISLYQINIRDPDGNHIHVDFPFEE